MTEVTRCQFQAWALRSIGCFACLSELCPTTSWTSPVNLLRSEREHGAETRIPLEALWDQLAPHQTASDHIHKNKPSQDHLLSPVQMIEHQNHELKKIALFTPLHFEVVCYAAAAAAAKLHQSCPTLCDPIDGSPPGSPIPGILQARTLEWVAISFSNAWKWKHKVKSLGRIRLPATPWTAAHQAPPSMGFSRQEYWSGVQFIDQWFDIKLFYIFRVLPKWSHKHNKVFLLKKA